MTAFVRARAAYTFNDLNQPERSVSVERGDVLPDDHWAVRGCSNPDAFEPIDLPWQAEDAVHALMGTRRELASLRARDNGRMPVTQRGRLQAAERREATLLEEIRSAVEGDQAQRDRIRALAGYPGAGESVADQQARDAAGQQTRTTTRQSGGPFGEARDEARRVIDRSHRDGELPAYAAERAEHLVTDGPEFGQLIAARWAVAVGDEAYRTAFAKKLAHGDEARDMWTDGERQAWARVQRFRAEQRAMGVDVDADGGFMVPLSLDPAIMLTSDGSQSPLRQLARVEQISTSEWAGVTSAGVTAEWLPEGQEAADASPTLAQPKIKVEKGDAYVEFSFEVGMDVAAFQTELGRVLRDAADGLQATAFTRGSGTDQPEGFITGATTTVLTAAQNTVAADDVYAVQAALPPRFQASARWAANLTVVNELDQFETGNGAKRFPQIGEGRLLRRSLHEVSDMTSDLTTTGAKPLAYGDFRAGFVIVDRIGTTLELVPHVFGANRRPTGRRGAILWFRTGAGVVVPEAFRVLEVDGT